MPASIQMSSCVKPKVRCVAGRVCSTATEAAREVAVHRLAALVGEGADAYERIGNPTLNLRSRIIDSNGDCQLICSAVVLTFSRLGLA